MTEADSLPPPLPVLAGSPSKRRKMKAIEILTRAWLVLLAFVVFFSAGLTATRAGAIVILYYTPVTYGTVQSSDVVYYNNRKYHSIDVVFPDRNLVSATYSTELPEFEVGDRVPIRAMRDVGRVDSITELYELPRLVKLVAVVVPIVWGTLWGLKRYKRQLEPFDPLWFRIFVYVSLVFGIVFFVQTVFLYVPWS